ncbi:MAG: prepilin-type N-terminal cleavage/methylation domain-containing protein [Candidatus Omnitrophica bacterium]|nr:prepilin-type N-terminal cleavage/methylation domain-containing protein [Candidatus Omnitrophota bacterium]
MKSNQAFTLMELIIVIIVIGAMVSLALPKFNDATEQARAQHGIQLLQHLYEAEKEYIVMHGTWAYATGTLQFTDPTPPGFNNLRFTNDPAHDPFCATIDKTGAYQYSLRVECNNGTIECGGSTNSDGLRLCKQIANGTTIMVSSWRPWY